MKIKAVIFDLDDTLVDTSLLRPFRDQRLWAKAVEQIGTTKLFPGIYELLSSLDEHSIPYAVVTTSISNYAWAVLKHHAIRCKELVAYHDAPKKPSPKPVMLAMNRLGVAASGIIGIGDNAHDQAAYSAAGVLSVGAAWSPAYQPCSWDCVAQTPHEVIAMLTAPMSE